MKTINSFRSKLLALTLALMASVSSYAKDGYPDFQVDELYYNFLERDSVQVTFLMPPTIPTEVAADTSNKKNVSGAGYVHLTEIVIPSTVIYEDKTYHVTRIGHGAFMYCPNLMHIDLPTSIKSIGEGTFNSCRYLSSITLNEGLESIEQQAFWNCSSLKEVSLPSTLKSLKQKVFYDSKTLSKVICKALVPPSVEKDLLTGTDNYNASIIPNATLYVPAESLEAYKTAAAWKDFGQILPIEPTSYKSQWCDTWNVMEHDMGMTSDTEKTWRHYLANDTIINGQTYTSVNYYWTLEESKVYKIAHVRFSEDKKVYALMDDTEYLVYDFSVQVGDTIETIVGAFSGSMLQQLLVHQIDIDGATNRKTITLYPICRIEDDEYDEDWVYLWDCCPVQWIEGVGSTDGFLMGYPPCGWVGGIGHKLLCAYKNDELKYTGDLYDEYGCEYNATEQKPEDLFPTLWGLQRTSFTEYSECSDSFASLFQSKGETITINHNQYLKFGGHYLREENKQVLLYSRLQDKDLVLYDYSLEVGDTLTTLNIDYRIEGIPFDLCYVDYAYEDVGMSHSIDTLIVTDVSYVTLLDGKEHKQWTFDNGMQYVEGIGNFGQSRWSGNFFGLVKEPAIPTCLMGEHLVCISKNNKLLYQMDEAEMERLGAECLCEYNAEQKPEDLFPTLWGLQRTSCDEWLEGCGENKSYLFAPKEVKEIKGKLYLKCGGVFLREEDSKVLIYSFPYEKDFVLYDYTLEVGSTLQNLGIDIYSFPELEYAAVVDYIAYEDYDVETGDFIIKKEPLGNKRVKDISTIRLLDGNEYKAWLFGYDWERGDYYIEGIGSFGGDYIDIANPYEIPACYLGERLVCASKNGQLLYQMDDAEMERLGTECLCDYNSGPKKDNAKNGKIGGRPTPTQWNMLEVETKEMDGTPTILRAETFSYTLENDSIVTKGKTFYQLARQSTKDTAITKSFVGALHFGEDEDNRVYFLRDGVEYVLYDFTAEPGDTIEIFAGINNYPQETTYTHVVVDKDTTEDGACRMFLEVVFPDETTTATNVEKVWLAGLGSIDGIVHNAAQRTSDVHAAPARSASSETQSSVMLCAWREDSCLYTTNHPEYDTFGCVYNQDPTAVEDVQTSGDKYQKIIRDGHLYILRDNKLYDVLGTPMN